MNNYKEVVEKICQLPWQDLPPEGLQNLMHLSYHSALEFAEALKITLRLYPNDLSLKAMAEGELGTDNLQYSDYRKVADHSEFLKHFIDNEDVQCPQNIISAAKNYRRFCAAQNDVTRAASIFSREEELSGIFECILTAKDWSAPGLGAFRYYLQRHIYLDSAPGGHRDLIKQLAINEDLTPFYIARYDMYLSIPSLNS